MASVPSDYGDDPLRCAALVCPSDNDLLSFIPGLLADEDAALVLSHLQSCPQCQSRVTTLKKKLSTEGGPSRAAAPAAGGNRAPAAIAVAERAVRADHSDATAATLAFSPNKRKFPAQLGNYQLLRPIGRGGMGIVYQAYHPRLQRYYAIKLLPGLNLGDDTAIVRLQREMAAAGRVEHENIVYSSDAGTQDGIDYLVMELVEGVDLAKLVAACHPLPVAEACEIIRQGALGLAHIEACGLVHRDIKPSNLMLSTKGVVKILDLGLARLKELPIDEAEATHSGFLIGTVDYIAPEQIDSPRTADVRSDLYSLGCALFKLLAGRAPFSDDEHSSVTRKIDAHRREPPPQIRTCRPDVPPALGDLLQRMLAKAPADRPQHPAEVAAELLPLAAGANLTALVKLATQEGTADRPPQTPASHTPSAAAESTRPQGATPTPQPQPQKKTRSRAVPKGAIWLVSVVLLGGLAIGAGGRIWNSIAAVIDPPSTLTVGPSEQVIDLREPLTEKIWPGYYPSTVKPAFDEDVRMLEVRSDSFRLLQLGDYDGEPAAFEVTIRQTPWCGYAGLFFGYRLEPKPDKPKVATFQLVMLKCSPLFDAAARAREGDLRLRRSRGWIDVLPVQFREELPWEESLLRDPAPDVRIRVEFKDRRCVGVYANGDKLEILSSVDANAGFENVDYVGPWGLYHDTGLGNHGPTWFGNVVITPLKGT